MKSKFDTEFVVYKITNRVTGKFYIGQTKNSAIIRWSSHKAAANNPKTQFHEAILRYNDDDYWTIETLFVMFEYDERMLRYIEWLFLDSCDRSMSYNTHFQSVFIAPIDGISVGDIGNGRECWNDSDVPVPLPEYISLYNGIYHYKRKIPLKLKKYYNVDSFMISMETDDLDEAITIVGLISERLHKQFTSLKIATILDKVDGYLK